MAKWIGLTEFLEREPKVTKDMLQAYVRNSPFPIEEVELGGAQTRRLKSEAALIAAKLYSENLPRAEHLKLANEYDDIMRALEQAEPFYAEPNLRLPGGEDYGELLLYMPQQQRASDTWLVLPEGDWAPGDRFATRAEAESYARRLRAQKPGAQVAIFPEPEPVPYYYDAPHFADDDNRQGNLIAHVRFTTRPDVDGRRTLFLEEVQSDWHQEGARLGYFDPHVAYAKINELSDALAAVYREYREAARLFNETERSDKLSSAEKLQALALVRQLEAKKLRLESELAAAKDVTKGAIDAPLKDAWPMTAIRRMIRYAVDEGIDQIAWTTGKTQSDRYNRTLANIVSAHASPDGTWRVWLRNESSPRSLNEARGAELERLLGDRKAVLRPDGSRFYDLSREPLSIISKGMRAFYDERLVNAVNKWAKKYGARVEETEVARARPWTIEPAPGDPDSPNAVRVKHPDTGDFHWFGTPAAAQEFLRGRRQRLPMEKAHRLRITPQMKEAAKKGMDIARIPTGSMAA
jgi:hypothetical protein